MCSRCTRRTAEADRVAVGVFTAMAHFDPSSAHAIVDEADPELVAQAALTLAGVLAGVLIRAAADHGVPARQALDAAAHNFGVITRSMRGGGDG